MAYLGALRIQRMAIKMWRESVNFLSLLLKINKLLYSRTFLISRTQEKSASKKDFMRLKIIKTFKENGTTIIQKLFNRGSRKTKGKNFKVELHIHVSQSNNLPFSCYF